MINSEEVYALFLQPILTRPICFPTIGELLFSWLDQQNITLTVAVFRWLVADITVYRKFIDTTVEGMSGTDLCISHDLLSFEVNGVFTF